MLPPQGDDLVTRLTRRGRFCPTTAPCGIMAGMVQPCSCLKREPTYDVVKYKSPHPGKRHTMQFHPTNGKLAWPHMTPHFGKRVPFARNHGGAPWLEPFHSLTDNSVLTATESGSGRSGNNQENTTPAKPGEQGRWSLCPEGAGRKQYNLVFINTPIELSGAYGDTPPSSIITV